jgi:hypothetical protein
VSQPAQRAIKTNGYLMQKMFQDAQPSLVTTGMISVLCKERDRLLHEYNSAVLEVSRAVGEWADLSGISSADDYALLSREKDRAKARLKTARSAYERHVTEHGCGEQTATASE